MAQCKCGCKKETKSGKYLPGHDQKLRTAIEKAAGGLDELKIHVEEKIGGKINADSQ